MVMKTVAMDRKRLSIPYSDTEDTGNILNRDNSGYEHMKSHDPKKVDHAVS
jgi:hypothetical protein